MKEKRDSLLLKSMYSLYALTLAFGDSITILISVILYKKSQLVCVNVMLT